MHTQKKRYYLYSSAIAGLLILLAVFMLFLMISYPEKAEIFVAEDRSFEILQVVLLFISSIGFLFLSLESVVRKKTIQGVCMAVMAAVCFVIGMEEVSWMQRVLSVESGQMFLQNNAQGETNFHNMSTHLFQNVYYFAGFILLIFLPFLSLLRPDLTRNRSAKKINRFSEVRDFLPAGWLFFPFAIISGLVWPTAYKHPTIMFALFATIIFCLVLSVVFIRDKKWFLLISVVISLALVAGSSYISLFDNQLHEIRSGAPTEYTETFISIGICMYMLDTWIRTSNARIRRLP